MLRAPKYSLGVSHGLACMVWTVIQNNFKLVAEFGAGCTKLCNEHLVMSLKLYCIFANYSSCSTSTSVCSAIVQNDMKWMAQFRVCGTKLHNECVAVWDGFKTVLCSSKMFFECVPWFSLHIKLFNSYSKWLTISCTVWCGSYQTAST